MQNRNIAGRIRSYIRNHPNYWVYICKWEEEHLQKLYDAQIRKQEDTEQINQLENEKSSK